VVPAWHDALVVITDKGRAVLAQCTTGENPEPLEDGPVAPDGFRHKGILYKGLRRKPFAALQTLWDSKDRCVLGSDLAVPVWEDREHEVDDNAVGNLRKNLNCFFRKKQVHFHAQIKRISGEYHLSLHDGPPPAKAVKRR
jgi:hypothetical protein